MIMKFTKSVGALAQKYGKFPRAADFKSGFQKVKAVSVKAKGKTMEYGSKAKAYVKKNPYKTAGAVLGTGIVGTVAVNSFQSIHKDMKKNLSESFLKLPKSDPRYKAVKKAGY